MNENATWRPTHEPQDRPSVWIRFKSLVWAWLKQQSRIRSYDNQWRKTL